MKVLHLSSSDSGGGAARSAYRLHKGLLALGTDSRMFVQKKVADDPAVIGAEGELRKGLAFLRPHLDKLPLKFYRKRSGFFSTGWLPDLITKQIVKVDPDIINLHWISGGFIRIGTLQDLSRPVAWTLHDSWAFTGGCHLPFECTNYTASCGRCPALGSKRELDLSRLVWTRKRLALKNVDLTVVSPSNWLRNCAENSSLFRDSRVEVIPNGIDTKLFRPHNKRSARDLLSLPQEMKLIMFSAQGGPADRNKGFHLLRAAIEKLAKAGWGEKAALVVAGSQQVDRSDALGMRVHCLGQLTDNISMVLANSAVDVVVVPSLQENLPNAVMESLACGTPVVGFDIGGNPDMIEDGLNGVLVKPYDEERLAGAIAWTLSDEAAWSTLSFRARQKILEDFSIEKQSRQYLRLYEEILSRDTQKRRTAGARST